MGIFKEQLDLSSSPETVDSSENRAVAVTIMLFSSRHRQSVVSYQ